MFKIKAGQTIYRISGGKAVQIFIRRAKPVAYGRRLLECLFADRVEMVPAAQRGRYLSMARPEKPSDIYIRIYPTRAMAERAIKSRKSFPASGKVLIITTPWGSPNKAQMLSRLERAMPQYEFVQWPNDDPAMNAMLELEQKLHADSIKVMGLSAGMLMPQPVMSQPVATGRELALDKQLHARRMWREGRGINYRK